MTTIVTNPPRLHSVPAAGRPSAPGGVAPSRRVHSERSWSTRAETCAFAVDDAARRSERAAEQARAVRLALLDGDDVAAVEAAVAVLEEARALAASLGEVHGELDELAHEMTPEGSA